MRTMQLQFILAQNSYFIVCKSKKNLFGQDSKDSNITLPYCVSSYSPVVGKGFLQRSQKYFHQAAGILTDFKPFLLVFIGQLGLELGTTEIKG